MSDNTSTENQPAGRPGAMTMAMNAVNLKQGGPKALRVGLIQNGKILDEKVFRSKETISIGSSEKNNFIVHEPGVPSRYELFQVIGGKYVLNFTEQMKGKVSLANGVFELSQLCQNGAARNTGSTWQIAIDSTTRGKIEIGSLSFLFQFVAAPAMSTKPQLPAAVRGGFVADIDWLFTSFVVFVFVFLSSAFVVLENYDYPIPLQMDVVPESVARLLFSEPPPPEEEKPQEVSKDSGEKDKPSKKPAKKAQAKAEQPEPASKANKAEASAARAAARARISQAAQAQAEAMILGALGKGGALADVLAGGAVTGNAESVLAQVSGVGVAQGGSSGKLRQRGGGEGSGRGGDLGSLKAGKGGAKSQTEGGAVKERQIRGKAKMGNGGDIGGSGDFDSALVVKTIKRKLSAIQRCYENELRRDPSLSGKITIQFTIQESGSVSGVKTTENSMGNTAVSSCIERTVKRFRFNPGPDGGSVKYSYPFVFAPQN